MEFDVRLHPAVLAVDTCTLASATLASKPPKPKPAMHRDGPFLVEHDAIDLTGRTHLPLFRNDQIKSVLHRQQFEIASDMVGLLLGRLRPTIRSDDDGLVCANRICESKD